MGSSPAKYRRVLRPTPLEERTRALREFLHIESTGGIVLMLCTLFALVAANSSWAEAYKALWETPLRITFAGLDLNYPVWYWINDALMAIFFFVIGLEIKRELVAGELSDRRNVLLPVAAAIGGAVVPAAIFAFVLRGQPELDGWAIPMATDIAFVVGCLALLGTRVPRGLKIFLLSLAIVDDILAVLVIAVFLSKGISVSWLLGGVGCLAVVLVMRSFRVRTVFLYVLAGAGLWLCTLKGGIHPTVAGVLLGLLTPTKSRVKPQKLLRVLGHVESSLKEEKEREGFLVWTSKGREALFELSEAATDAVAPLSRLEHLLHPWVSYAIMPLFALANAGVPIRLDGLGEPLVLGVALGLVVGKPLGVVIASYLAVRVGGAALPAGVTGRVLIGAGCLAGIGFTMSLFIASLALDQSVLVLAKTGVLAGSLLSAILGMSILFWALRPSAGSGPQQAG